MENIGRKVNGTLAIAFGSAMTLLAIHILYFILRPYLWGLIGMIVALFGGGIGLVFVFGGIKFLHPSLYEKIVPTWLTPFIKDYESVTTEE